MKDQYIAIGIGNPLLMDDRAGIAVVERLEAAKAPMATEIMYTVGFEVVDALLGKDCAYVIDATVLGREPGDVLELTADELFTTAYLVNSHAMTLGTTLKLGYELFPDEMPGTLRIILIQITPPTAFSPELSPPVERAVERVVAGILHDVNQARHPGGSALSTPAAS